MDGALNFYKPKGITSAKALYRIRKITGIRKSGHAGTLDPAAEGVLVICLGKGTKLTELWMNQPKVYRAMARLDWISASHDADHPTSPVNVPRIPDPETLQQALSNFQGRIEQVPPQISAIKVDGRRAYKSVRSGKTVDLKPRPVEIYAIRLLRYCWPEIEFDVTCGRGTYIRSLIRDLGAALHTGGCLTALRRTQVGPFHERNSWTFDRLEETPDPSQWCVPYEELRHTLQSMRIPQWTDDLSPPCSAV